MGKKWGTLPRGVKVRTYSSGNQAIQVAFTYKGVECKEILDLVVSRASINAAINLLGEIKHQIALGAFSYVKYFPASSKLKVFGYTDKSTEIIHYLNDYIQKCEDRKLSHTTIDGYLKCKRAFKRFYYTPVAELTPKMILAYIEDSHVTQKTLRNRLSFLSSALEKAIVEGVIQNNPVKQIKISLYTKKAEKVSTRGVYEEIDAFLPKEVEAIRQYCKPVELNICDFKFETGVRCSEWAGIKWMDIDFVNGFCSIEEAFTQGQTKTPKTSAGRRRIKLSQRAIDALKRQKEHTFLKGDFVFLNAQGKPWNTESFRKHRWTRILKAAGVRYRYPYQSRHTFAVREISMGTNVWDLAKKMGHSSPEMIFRHYGSFLKEYEETGRIRAYVEPVF